MRFLRPDCIGTLNDGFIRAAALSIVIPDLIGNPNLQYKVYAGSPDPRVPYGACCYRNSSAASQDDMVLLGDLIYPRNSFELRYWRPVQKRGFSFAGAEIVAGS